MAAQTDAGMEREDPGLMTCILLLEEDPSLGHLLVLDLDHAPLCQSARPV